MDEVEIREKLAREAGAKVVSSIFWFCQAHYPDVTADCSPILSIIRKLPLKPAEISQS